MNWQALLFLVIGSIGLWFPQVQGLKCYICDSTMDSCYSNVSSKYLKDCHDTAQGCTTFSLENRRRGRLLDKPGARWFQRSCFYWHANGWFGADDAGKLPHEENEIIQFQHTYQVHAANSDRTERGIEELPIPNIYHFNFSIPGAVGYVPFNRIRFCGTVSDGCNDWDGEPPFPLAEGFPALEVKTRKYDLSCWSCTLATYLTRFSEKACEDIKDIQDDYYIKKVKKSSKQALGCSIHSIYQTSPTGATTFFERAFWFPGDHWCLRQRFPSTPPSIYGRSVAQFKKTCKEGNVAEDTCSNGFSRAIGGEDNEHLSYSWTGQRTFYSPKEFYDFTHCKLAVRLRSGVWEDVEMRIVEEIKKAADEFVEGSEPFAFVGFHLCGPNKNDCNDWSDDKLYKMMDNPPTTTTTTTTSSSTTETTTPAILNNETSPGGVYPGEVTGEGCCATRESRGGKLSFGIVSVLLPLAASVVFEMF